MANKSIAIKDNISTDQDLTTSGSAILANYRSPYNADCVTRLQDAGATINQKTNLDEFGMGSNSTHSAFGHVSNIYAEHLSAGGSSGGSAVAVASDACFAALGTDTGGSVRLPAAYNGIVGFKPSYGAISRWGVLAYAHSLDTVGVIAKTVNDVEVVFNAIKTTGSQDPTQQLYKQPAKKSRPWRIGIPLEYNTKGLTPLVRAAWSRTLTQLLEAGHTLHTISLPTTSSALSAYYVLAPAEASSNLAKYEGVRYGEHAGVPRTAGNVLFSQTRGQLLGEEVRRRILLGTFNLSAGAMDNYFLQAQKIRRLVQQDFDRVFAAQNPLHDDLASREVGEDGCVDFIVAPTSQSLPPRLEDVQQGKGDPINEYGTDVLTVPANLAGLPAVSVPVPIPQEFGAEAGPVERVGMQVFGQIGDDEEVLRAAKAIEEFSRVK